MPGTILITGVSGGIGRGIASLFGEKGWRVFGADRVADAKVEWAEYVWQGDVSEPAFWEEISRSTLLRDGLDVLVNNAAVQLNKSLMGTSSEEWEVVHKVNLKGCFLGIRSMAPLMSGRNASIINISSVHALVTSANIAAYAASKGGMVSLTRAAALELAGQGIRVNAVLPGAIDTNMLDDGLCRSKMHDADIVTKKQALAERTPCGRIGTPRDVAGAVMFLAEAGLSSFVTGQMLVVDGGASIRLSTE